ncbi:MAG: hypothetical protein QOJ11_3455 [Frankiales bacterium]|jgi:hypothetical protein|nr:hypothetical protein [Frankiales bacterium]
MPSAKDERLRPAPLAATLPVEVPAAAAGPGRRAAWLAALPLALAAALAALTLVAAICLLNNHYRAALVLPIGLPAAALAGWVVLRRAPAAESRTVWPNLVALAVVAGTVGFNLGYSAQDIVVARDPGTYALTAQWIAHHESARIGTDAAVFGNPPGVTASSVGFGDTKPGEVQTQYPNAAPMLVAMGGWISDAWLLRVAPFIGGAALLAFFALARGFVREWWALGAMTLLAVSLPMMHFSRAVYSEPTAMVFLLGGMALLFACEQRAGIPLHIVAGLTGGATGLARIDGGIFLLAVAGYGTMKLARAPEGVRRRAGLEVGALLLATLVPYVIGIRLFATLSPLYWYGHNGHAPEAIIPGVLALLIALIGAAVVAVAWRGGTWRAAGERLVARLSTGVAGLLIVLAVIGATRPLWLTAHQYIGPTYTNWIAFWQRDEHAVIDGTRSYAENTLTWLSWYDSVIVVAGGVLGIAWLVRRFGRTGRPAVCAFLLIFVSYSLVSLTYPDITPDQIWSIRRFLPIVIPGLLIGAASFGRRLARGGRGSRVGVGVLCLAALVLTLRTDQPLARVREGVPQLAEVENVCDNLPRNAAVVVGAGLWFGYTMTVRSYCQVPVTGLPSSANPKNYHPLQASELAQIRTNAAAAGRTLVLLTDDAASLPAVGGVVPKVTPISRVVSNRWKPSLTSAVSETWPDRRTLYLLTVHPDGTVSSPAGQHTLVATG